MTSNICLAIAFCYAEKKQGRRVAKKKTGVLTQLPDIADCGKKEASMAVKDKKVLDFEDGLQYYAALHCGCECIVTSYIEDFYFSDLPVYLPEWFFRKYVL